MHWSGLYSASNDRDDGCSIHGYLAALGLAHPSRLNGAEDAARSEKTVDCSTDGVGVRIIVREVEVSGEARLSQSVRDDGVGVAKCQASESQYRDDAEVVRGVSGPHDALDIQETISGEDCCENQRPDCNGGINI